VERLHRISSHYYLSNSDVCLYIRTPLGFMPLLVCICSYKHSSIMGYEMRFFCRICQEWCGGRIELSHHHKFPFAIFGDGEVVECCRTKCHDALNELIREKENAILVQHPEIYEDALKEMSGNQEMIDFYYAKIEERRKQKRNKGWRYTK